MTRWTYFHTLTACQPQAQRSGEGAPKRSAGGSGGSLPRDDWTDPLLGLALYLFLAGTLYLGIELAAL